MRPEDLDAATFAEIIANLGTVNGHVLLCDAYEKEKQQVVAALARGRQVWNHHADERDKIGDVVAMVTNMNPDDILFIDEIDRWSRQVQEILKAAIIEHGVELTIANRPFRIEMPPIICVAATAKVTTLSHRLREAFSVHVDCVLPSLETLEEVLQRERAEKRAKRLKSRNEPR